MNCKAKKVLFGTLSKRCEWLFCLINDLLNRLFKMCMVLADCTNSSTIAFKFKAFSRRQSSAKLSLSCMRNSSMSRLTIFLKTDSVCITLLLIDENSSIKICSVLFCLIRCSVSRKKYTIDPMEAAFDKSLYSVSLKSL